MRVHVESGLSCSPEDAWQQVCRVDRLRQVTWPLVTFSPVDNSAFPERWRAGTTLRMKCRLFGIVPLGVQSLHFERIDATARQIQTREHSRLMRRWDHLITVRPHDSETRYSDTVEIDAGRLTPLVWMFAQGFYRYRQRRWRRIAWDLRRAPSTTDHSGAECV